MWVSADNREARSLPVEFAGRFEPEQAAPPQEKNYNTFEPKTNMALTGKVLVTGGAGFIGSHIASALATNGARVRIVDDLSTGHRENIEEIKGDIDFVQGSIADEAVLKKALEGVEL